MESVMQRVDRRACIPATLHAGYVKAITLRVVADRQRKRQRIFDNDRVTTDVSLFANAAELMDTGVSTDVRAILDHDVARERRSISHDDAVADQAIVRDMRLGHDEAIVADACDHAAACGAAMNRNELTDLISCADARLRRFAFVLEILRREADRDKRKNVRLITNRSAAIDDTV